MKEDDREGPGTSRRTFVQMATAGLALAAIPRRASGGVAPSDRIRVGFIGLGGQGTGRLTEFLRHADVDAAAVCDLDREHLERAAALVEKARGTRPETYHDFRKLLERKDIDAVMVATPDHWHALPTVQACQAGKDVFVEKPLCHSIGEGRAMAEGGAQTQPRDADGQPYPQRPTELPARGGTGALGHAWARSIASAAASTSGEKGHRQAGRRRRAAGRVRL